MDREGYQTIMAYWNLLPDEIKNQPEVTTFAVLLDKYGHILSL
jgi:hypothetical protein